MKFLVTLMAIVATFSTSFAQEAKKPSSPRVTAESANVSVSYGQPSKKGRQIFGSLVPFDKVWRTGANEATEVTFKKDVTVGGKKLAAGTYTLFTVPGAKSWKFIFNSELKQWGSYDYEKIKGKDVANVKAKPTRLSAPVEALTFEVSDSAITLKWDTTSVTVPLKF